MHVVRDAILPHRLGDVPLWFNERAFWCAHACAPVRDQPRAVRCSCFSPTALP